MAAALCSMTGFGSGRSEADGRDVSIEMRSLNHRYLKISTHIPEELAWAQKEVEGRVRARFVRGSIDVYVNLREVSPSLQVDLDEELFRRIYGRLSALRDEMCPGQEIRLAEILPVPGVVRTDGESRLEDSESLVRALWAGLERAMESLREMQVREGAHLQEQLMEHVGSIAANLDRIEELLPEAAAANRERYQARLREFLAGSGVEIQARDVMKEVAILAEKSDITEEVGRLRGHLTQFEEAMGSGGRIGRKLDFLTQEMFREANTMAAKANQYELARVVVEMKAEIDRLREQTQNIE